MELFDPQLYEVPRFDEVNWMMTKKELGTFMRAYKTSRERVGLPSFPKLTYNEFVIQQEVVKYKDLPLQYKESFYYFDKYFRHGLTAIMHPFQPELTDRQRNVFYLRYIVGLSIPLVSERIHYQKNSVIEDSKTAIIQFTRALDILQLNK